MGSLPPQSQLNSHFIILEFTSSLIPYTRGRQFVSNKRKKMLSYKHTLCKFLHKYKWKTKCGIMKDNTTWYHLHMESKKKRNSSS